MDAMDRCELMSYYYYYLSPVASPGANGSWASLKRVLEKVLNAKMAFLPLHMELKLTWNFPTTGFSLVPIWAYFNLLSKLTQGGINLQKPLSIYKLFQSTLKMKSGR